MRRHNQGLFFVTLGPFALFNVQKTKFIQFTTSFFRWSGMYRTGI